MQPITASRLSASSPALQLLDIHKQVQMASAGSDGGAGERLSILQGIHLTINRGESVAIVGASGSGKSTLLGIMAGLDLPSSGQLSLLGQRLDQLDEDQRAQVRADGVGFVFQNFQLLPGLTALENVMLPLEIRKGVKASAARETAGQLLQRVGLGHRLQHYPSQLSGGEQQRVALARAFAGQPQILFADEPTGNLDRNTGHQIEDLLFAMNAEQGTTLVLVTHDPLLANRCGRRVRVEDGRIREDLEYPDHPVSQRGVLS